MIDIFERMPLAARPLLTSETAFAIAEAQRTNGRARAIGMSPVRYEADKLPQHAAVEIKADGIGLTYFSDHIWTLEGVPMDCAYHLLEPLQLLERAFCRPMFFQGEYIEPGGIEAATRAFALGKGEGAALLFEAVPLAVWEGDEPSAILFDRRKVLEAVFNVARPAGVGLMQHAQGFDQEGVELAAGAAWQDGEEGLVVKDLLSPFVRGSSRAWMKVKREESVDVPIASVALKGEALDYLVVTVDGRPTRIASGFKDRERADPAAFQPGRIVEIGHMGRTSRGLLKSPWFKRLRPDKER